MGQHPTGAAGGARQSGPARSCSKVSLLGRPSPIRMSRSGVQLSSMAMEGTRVFALQSHEERPDIFQHPFRVVEPDPADTLVHGVIPCKLQYRMDHPGTGRADALHFPKLLLTCFQDPAKAAEMLDQPVCQWIGILPVEWQKTKDIPEPHAPPDFPGRRASPAPASGPDAPHAAALVFWLVPCCIVPILCFVPGGNALPYPIIIHVFQINEKSEVIL